MLNLYTTYFSASELRQSELDRCLKENIENPLIDQIFIFTEVPQLVLEKFGSTKINLIEYVGAPMYFDWIEHSKKLPFGDISIFANADIFFDSSIKKLNDLKEKSIVCLSRNESGQHGPEPEWSQDVWVVRAADICLINFENELRIRTGTPGCDNKIASVFALKGWGMFNPFNQIKAIHVHSSGERNYRKVDAAYAGCLVAVYESGSFDEPSEFSVHVMPVCSAKIREAGLNTWLEDSLRKSVEKK
jgi:hypothetical protein